MICIHHNKDLDGYSSGAIVKLNGMVALDCILVVLNTKNFIEWNKKEKNERISRKSKTLDRGLFW